MAGAPPRLFTPSDCQRDFHVNEMQLFQKQVAQKRLVHGLLWVLSSQDQLLFLLHCDSAEDSSLMLSADLSMMCKEKVFTVHIKV
jgi:hypothetical protein